VLAVLEGRSKKTASAATGIRTTLKKKKRNRGNRAS